MDEEIKKYDDMLAEEFEKTLQAAREIVGKKDRPGDTGEMTHFVFVGEPIIKKKKIRSVPYK